MTEHIRRLELLERKGVLVAYLQSCAAAEDWHGVRDAAVDIEIVSARIDMLMYLE